MFVRDVGEPDTWTEWGVLESFHTCDEDGCPLAWVRVGREYVCCVRRYHGAAGMQRRYPPVWVEWEKRLVDLELDLYVGWRSGTRARCLLFTFSRTTSPSGVRDAKKYMRVAPYANAALYGFGISLCDMSKRM